MSKEQLNEMKRLRQLMETLNEAPNNDLVKASQLMQDVVDGLGREWEDLVNTGGEEDAEAAETVDSDMNDYRKIVELLATGKGKQAAKLYDSLDTAAREYIYDHLENDEITYLAKVFDKLGSDWLFVDEYYEETLGESDFDDDDSLDYTEYSDKTLIDTLDDVEFRLNSKYPCSSCALKGNRTCTDSCKSRDERDAAAVKAELADRGISVDQLDMLEGTCKCGRKDCKCGPDCDCEPVEEEREEAKGVNDKYDDKLNCKHCGDYFCTSKFGGECPGIQKDLFDEDKDPDGMGYYNVTVSIDGEYPEESEVAVDYDTAVATAKEIAEAWKKGRWHMQTWNKGDAKEWHVRGDDGRMEEWFVVIRVEPSDDADAEAWHGESIKLDKIAEAAIAGTLFEDDAVLEVEEEFKLPMGMELVDEDTDDDFNDGVIDDDDIDRLIDIGDEEDYDDEVDLDNLGFSIDLDD